MQNTPFISAILDTISALVIALDRDGRMVLFNPECERVSGYLAHEVLGRPFWDVLLVPEEQEEVRQVFERLKAGEIPNRHENHWLTKGGGQRLIAWSNTVQTDDAGLVEFVIGTGIDLTDRQRMETALAESEDRYRHLFNSGHDAILVHPVPPGGPPGTFIDVNDIACARLGYTREELRRLTPADIDADTTAEANQTVMRQLEAQGHALFEREHRTRDGRRIPVEINAHLFQLHGRRVALSIARDISERKQAEAALRESEARLREITSELGDGIYVLGPRGELTFMNKAAEKMLGWSEAELHGRNAHDAFHYQRHDGTRVPMCDCPVYQAMHSGETYRIHEDWFTRKDGTLFPISFVAAPLHRGGAIVGSVAAFQDISERHEAEARIRHMAHHDALTGLPNRVLLTDRLEQGVARARRQKQGLALLFLDLDQFKEINDTLGHDVGDAVLKEAAARLRECIREMDTVARMGGDEFVILLNDVHQPEDAITVAEKALEALRRPVPFGEKRLGIGVSIGIALFPDHGEDAQTLMKRADIAMYRAKTGGRNCYRLYGEEHAA